MPRVSYCDDGRERADELIVTFVNEGCRELKRVLTELEGLTDDFTKMDRSSSELGGLYDRIVRHAATLQDYYGYLWPEQQALLRAAKTALERLTDSGDTI